MKPTMNLLKAQENIRNLAAKHGAPDYASVLLDTHMDFLVQQHQRGNKRKPIRFDVVQVAHDDIVRWFEGEIEMAPRHDANALELVRYLCRHVPAYSLVALIRENA